MEHPSVEKISKNIDATYNLGLQHSEGIVKQIYATLKETSKNGVDESTYRLLNLICMKIRELEKR